MNNKKQDNTRSKAIELAKLAAYQAENIVSREIIRTKSGTVSVFAFDKGESLSEHTAPFEAMLYVIDGEASVTVSGKVNKVKKNELIMLPANKPHAVKALKRFKMLLVMVRG